MLVLERKFLQRIFIGPDITVQVVDIREGKVRLGIEAPRDVRIKREELVTHDERKAL